MSSGEHGPADLVVRNAAVHTLDRFHPRAEALAVVDGRFTAVGDEIEVDALIGPATEVVDAEGRMVMPGIVDVHSHVGFGGRQAAWELVLSPAFTIEEILGSVRDQAAGLGADEWLVGGVIPSPVFHRMGNRQMLAALDDAAGGRPVMLRDDSLHNRWVNSRAMELMGISASTPDRDGGSYARDEQGHPVGLLFEKQSTDAELAASRSVRDGHERDLHSARTAVSIFNSVGVTATQDAATMGAWLDVFNELDCNNELNAWIVASMPAREFIESGPAGSALFATAAARTSAHVRPDFVKAVLDGVPMTRTAKFLEPYKPDPYAGPSSSSATHACAFHGNGLFTDEELALLLGEALSLGLNAKLHATGDGTVRQALDAIEKMRRQHGDAAVFQIAHPEFVHPDDVARFVDLRVVADASPVLWFPNPMNEVIEQQIGDHYMDRIWPFRELVDAGALLAAGSDWPVAMPVPNPWLSLETMITRRNPDPAFSGILAEGQAISLSAAIAAHTVNAATATGLGAQTGRLATGLSADFLILDRDLFDIPVHTVHETRVEQTWFAGRLVYDRAH